MQIDWFTFVAQLVNFVVLVALLKRFLYGPIVEAMDAREARIAARLEEAREKAEAAEQEAERYRSMQAEVERQRQQQIAQAEAEAEERRQALIQDAREEVERLETEWREALARDRDAFVQELSEQALRETIAVARRTLTDLAGADLEARAIDVFIDRLHQLDDAERRSLSEALRAAGGTAVVRTAFGDIEAYRQPLQEALAAQLEQRPELEIEQEAEVGFGIELRIGDHKVAWSLDGYLAQLTDQVRERLEAELHHGHRATPATDSVNKS